MVEKIFDEFENTQELMLKELKRINAKGDLSKEELCAIKEMAEAIYKMQIAEAMLNESEAGMSEYYNESMMNDGYYGGRGSYARGRDMRTGRYVSRRGGYRSYEGNQEGRMSSHSLHDRMIASLENMMDQAGSDYERQKLGEWIHKIQMDENKQ